MFHTGERQHVSTAGSLAPLCGTAAQGLRSAKHYFRSSSPSMPHDHAAGTRRSRLATLAPPAVKVFFNTILQQSGNFPSLEGGGIRTPPRRRLRSRPTARLEIETLRFCRSGKEFPKPGAVRLPAGRSKERCSGLSVFFEAFFSQRAFLTPWGRLRPARRLSVQFSSGGCSARFFAELAAVLAASSGGKGAAGR